MLTSPVLSIYNKLLSLPAHERPEFAGMLLNSLSLTAPEIERFLECLHNCHLAAIMYFVARQNAKVMRTS